MNFIYSLFGSAPVIAAADAVPMQPVTVAVVETESLPDAPPLVREDTSALKHISSSGMLPMADEPPMELVAVPVPVEPIVLSSEPVESIPLPAESIVLSSEPVESIAVVVLSEPAESIPIEPVSVESVVVSLEPAESIPIEPVLIEAGVVDQPTESEAEPKPVGKPAESERTDPRPTDADWTAFAESKTLPPTEKPAEQPWSWPGADELASGAAAPEIVPFWSSVPDESKPVPDEPKPVSTKSTDELPTVVDNIQAGRLARCMRAIITKKVDRKPVLTAEATGRRVFRLATADTETEQELADDISELRQKLANLRDENDRLERSARHQRLMLQQLKAKHEKRGARFAAVRSNLNDELTTKEAAVRQTRAELRKERKLRRTECRTATKPTADEPVPVPIVIKKPVFRLTRAVLRKQRTVKRNEGRAVRAECRRLSDDE